MVKRKKVYKQTKVKGTSRKADKKRTAKKVGRRRVSKGKNKGKYYVETRENRSDKNKKKKL